MSITEDELVVGVGSKGCKPVDENWTYRKDTRSDEGATNQLYQSAVDELGLMQIVARLHNEKLLGPHLCYKSLNKDILEEGVNKGSHKDGGDFNVSIHFVDTTLEKILEVKCRPGFPRRRSKVYLKQDRFDAYKKTGIPVLVGADCDNCSLATFLTTEDLLHIEQSRKAFPNNAFGGKETYDVDLKEFPCFDIHTLEPLDIYIERFNRAFGIS